MSSSIQQEISCRIFFNSTYLQHLLDPIISHTLTLLRLRTDRQTSSNNMGKHHIVSRPFLSACVFVCFILQNPISATLLPFCFCSYHLSAFCYFSLNFLNKLLYVFSLSRKNKLQRSSLTNEEGVLYSQLPACIHPLTGW